MKIILIKLSVFLFFLFVISSPLRADLDGAVSMTSESAQDFGADLVSLPVDIIRLTGSAIWLVGELLISPLFLFAK